MSEEAQRSLSGYKSKVHEQGEFENPNEGKSPLTEFDEYILRLKAFPKVKSMPVLKKVNGVDKTINVDKAICIFEEETTKNEVLSMMRVDSLNFSDDDAFESAIIRFFRKIQHPLREGVEPNWDDYFVTGMRFRARVVMGKDQNKKSVVGKYYLDVPTCRPLLPSDKNDGTPAPAKPDATLTNALLLAKGAKDSMEAYFKLADAKAPVDLIAIFVQADKLGQVSYPI